MEDMNEDKGLELQQKRSGSKEEQDLEETCAILACLPGGAFLFLVGSLVSALDWTMFDGDLVVVVVSIMILGALVIPYFVFFRLFIGLAYFIRKKRKRRGVGEDWEPETMAILLLTVAILILCVLVFSKLSDNPVFLVPLCLTVLFFGNTTSPHSIFCGGGDSIISR